MSPTSAITLISNFDVVYKKAGLLSSRDTCASFLMLVKLLQVHLAAFLMLSYTCVYLGKAASLEKRTKLHCTLRTKLGCFSVGLAAKTLVA